MTLALRFNTKHYFNTFAFTGRRRSVSLRVNMFLPSAMPPPFKYATAMMLCLRSVSIQWNIFFEINMANFFRQLDLWLYPSSKL